MAAELVRGGLHLPCHSVTLWRGCTAVSGKAQHRRQRQQHPLRVRPLTSITSKYSLFMSSRSYDDNDFYDVLAAITNPNHAAATTGCVSWGVIKVRVFMSCADVRACIVSEVASGRAILPALRPPAHSFP
jgi:hypothetical protein